MCLGHLGGSGCNVSTRKVTSKDKTIEAIVRSIRRVISLINGEAICSTVDKTAMKCLMVIM